MIVVAIIAIIASIAIPQLMSARLSANESAAIATLRSISSAQAQLQSSGAIDTDADGGGEYGYFGELAGAQPLRVSAAGVPAAGVVGTDELNPAVLSAAFGNVNADRPVVDPLGLRLPDLPARPPTVGAATAGIAEDAGGGKLRRSVPGSGQRRDPVVRLRLAGERRPDRQPRLLHQPGRRPDADRQPRRRWPTRGTDDHVRPSTRSTPSPATWPRRSRSAALRPLPRRQHLDRRSSRVRVLERFLAGAPLAMRAAPLLRSRGGCAAGRRAARASGSGRRAARRSRWSTRARCSRSSPRARATALEHRRAPGPARCAGRGGPGGRGRGSRSRPESCSAGTARAAARLRSFSGR